MDKKSTKFFSLYTNIQGRLHSVIIAIVHNQTVADDLLQETAATMWEKFDKFQEGTNFSAWAIRIAKNKCFEYLRMNKETKKLFHDEFYHKIAEIAENTSNDFPRRLKALDNCCEKLDINQRTLLKLRYTDNVPIKDLSIRFGQPISTLYKRIADVLDLLRRCITKSLSSQVIQET